MFVNTDVHRNYERGWEVMDAHIDRGNLEGEERDKYIAAYKKAHPIGKASVADVAEHIDHAVKLVFELWLDEIVHIFIGDVECLPDRLRLNGLISDLWLKLDIAGNGITLYERH